jgi:hypothetical protein
MCTDRKERSQRGLFNANVCMDTGVMILDFYSDLSVSSITVIVKKKEDLKI